MPACCLEKKDKPITYNYTNRMIYVLI